MKLYNKIGLGTVQFGLDYGINNYSGKTSPDQVSSILRYAADIGICYLDTAAAYGDSESVLGKNKIQNFKVITKFMPPENGATIGHELQQSLNKLGIEKIYGFLAHRPSALLENKDHWSSLKKLKDEGKIEKIGFSLNETKELDDLLAVGFLPDLIQVPYNFFDSRFQQHMIYLKNHGCEIHVRSVFLQGLFFIKPDNLSSHFEPIKYSLKTLQEQHKGNLSGALLKFVLEKSFVDVVIVGVENRGQLEQNYNNISMAEVIDDISPELKKEILMPSLWPSTK